MDVRYWSKALSALLRQARDRDFRREWLAAGVSTRLKAPERTILDLYPQAADVAVDMGRVTYRLSNMDPMEQYCLRVIALVTQPKRIFEIGTYDGATTLALAAASPDAEVITLDLPPEEVSAATMHDEADNVASGVGRRFADTAEGMRITQLLGDSLTFDFSPFAGTCDLVVVDAGHDYENAVADTVSARRLLRAGGVIVWDDYEPGWPGVVRAVDESGLSVVRLAHTGLAVHLAGPGS